MREILRNEFDVYKTMKYLLCLTIDEETNN